jgi:alkylation response protein AidB-like acyl-CoA dehydrogenase
VSNQCLSQTAEDRPDVFARIASHAFAADRGEITLAADLRDLHASGHMAAIVKDTGPCGNAVRAAELLRRIGRASLSVGRLVEGHANAMLLITLYGTTSQRDRAGQDVARGRLYGVWGADGEPPLSLAGTGSHPRLSGSKAFCSGLGLVDCAVLTARQPSGAAQMLLADVSDPSRADASAWQVSGMRATASGRYDFNGVDAELLGRPGDLLHEPHFEGGTWRYAALHVGGLEALAEAFRAYLKTRGRADEPLQRRRLADIVGLAETARLRVESAATAVATADAGNVELAVARALLAREAVEQCCLEAMAICDRGIGTLGFRSGSLVDLVRRDLGLFLRQANLDGKLEMAAQTLLDAPSVVGEMW